MHIPTCESSQLDILSFDEALRNSGSRGDYDANKWLYVPDYYADYRYILGTRGKNPLICIGINPSTAAPDDLDNTLKSVARIATANGYDSWIMFNVYAQRATNPDDMDKTLNEKLHRENMLAFEYILKNVGEGISPAIWAAWGTIIEKRPYLRDCVLDMVELGQRYGANWFSAGKKSVKGHPHHPLYLRKDAATEAFDIVGYLEVIK